MRERERERESVSLCGREIGRGGYSPPPPFFFFLFFFFLSIFSQHSMDGEDPQTDIGTKNQHPVLLPLIVSIMLSPTGLRPDVMYKLLAASLLSVIKRNCF